MAASTAAASSASTSNAVPHPTSVSPGRSNSTVGLPSNWSASGPYSRATVRACSPVSVSASLVSVALASVTVAVADRIGWRR